MSSSKGTCCSARSCIPTRSAPNRSGVTLHLTPKLALTLLLATLPATAQTTPEPQQEPLPPPQGKVLFERHADTPQPSGAPGPDSGTRAATTAPEPPTSPQLTDADRAAITLTAYDLDVRITPAASALAMRARLTLRNTSTTPVTRIALQISSTLHWEAVSTNGQPLSIYQHPLDTDADHTGRATEAVLTLPTALAAGGSMTLDTLYTGTIPASTARQQRIGAAAEQAASVDWDAISPTGTALRGMGQVLWYPIAAPQLFLGDGAALFQAIGRARLAGQDTPIHLHLSVEYQGEPPVAAYFCGRRRPLTALNDDPAAPTAAGIGIATADFPQETLGFRLPSLFLIDHPEILLPNAGAPSSTSTLEAPDTNSSSSTPTAPTLLAVETADGAALPRLTDSALSLTPLLTRWFGPHPLSTLTLLDHTGQPFADGPFVVAPVASLAASDAASPLLQSLTHAWVQTGQPWIDEGLPQFMALLYTESEKGRDAAISQLTTLTQPLALVEPALDPNSPGLTPSPTTPTSAIGQTPINLPGQPLIAAQDDIYFRTKAAAVWWMLRDITSDNALQQALATLVTQPVSTDTARNQAIAFQKLLEKTSGKDLAWFFNDWVLNDHGLPDLSIADVTPRELPGDLKHKTGWLVAITVRNDGAAAAEVPVTVRSGTYTTTRRLRIPAFSTATDRVLLEAPPTGVSVNDGSTPEVRSTTHTRSITMQAQ